jgi:Domain of unknown function (DUF4350)
MARRRDLLVAATAASLLMVIAFAAGSSGRATDDPDPRASSFLSGRAGTRALADAAERLGVEVVRWRRRPQALDSAWAGREATLAVLSPSVPVSAAERDVFVRWPMRARGGALVLAGESARSIVRCFGYLVESSVFDSSRVVAHGTGRAAGAAAAKDDAIWVHARLAGRTATPSQDIANEGQRRRPAAPRERRRVPSEAEACPAVRVTAADTLLSDEDGAPVLVQVTVGPHQRSVLLASDAALVRNRSLRRGRTGAIVAASMVPRRGALLFDEYHHGFAPDGSMARVTLAWSLRHPVGWMVWQLVLVGLVALAAGARRFGPVRAAIPRRRRDAREHVRALATALASAQGHHEAVAALVRGLRRRLSPAAAPAGGAVGAAVGRNGSPPLPRDDWRPWLVSLGQQASSAAARAAAARLLQLADAPRGDAAVVEAARAVDALRDALRPTASPQ